jgi:GT2 family glycosyltransferase
MSPAEDRLAVAVLAVGADPRLADAVASLLSQAPRPEVVVVNTGGGDARSLLGELAAEVRIVERDQRLYPGAARNLGIEATSAAWVGFLAADCTARPGWVAARLREHRAGARAVAGVLENAEPESRVGNAATLLLHHRMLADTPPRSRRLYGLSYERELFAEHGRFREDFRTGEDTELNSRLARAGVAITRAADVRTAHRHPASVSGLLRDLYMRGVRQERARRSVLGQRRPGPGIAYRSLLNVRAAVRQARLTADPRERRRLLSSWPLLAPGAVAYAAGALASFSRARLEASGQSRRRR